MEYFLNIFQYFGAKYCSVRPVQLIIQMCMERPSCVSHNLGSMAQAQGCAEEGPSRHIRWAMRNLWTLPLLCAFRSFSFKGKASVPLDSQRHSHRKDAQHDPRDTQAGLLPLVLSGFASAFVRRGWERRSHCRAPPTSWKCGQTVTLSPSKRDL